METRSAGSVFVVKEPTEHPGRVGIAVDAGSTMLAGALYNLTSGELLVENRSLNPQTCIGSDVLSRIEYARSASGRTELTRLLREGIRSLMQDLLDVVHVEREAICRCVISGNTTILHFLSGLDPTAIGAYPYTPASFFGAEYESKDLMIGEGFPVYLPPCVSAFVGADIVCGMMTMDVPTATPQLLVDLGTNGEMALCADDTILCASAAAGPVFEGGGTICGMPALPGAIERVWAENGRIEYAVIGDEEPQGICGSGLIDAIALFLDSGLMDDTGHFGEESDMLRKTGDGETAVFLAPDVYITQGDVRRFQTAKAAIAAGLFILMAECGVPDASLLLAGGLGSSLNVHSARRVGLVPNVCSVHAAGNTSLQGAAMLLLDPEKCAKAQQLVVRSHVTDLAAHPAFAGQYVEEMLFPIPTEDNL